MWVVVVDDDDDGSGEVNVKGLFEREREREESLLPSRAVAQLSGIWVTFHGHATGFSGASGSGKLFFPSVHFGVLLSVRGIHVDEIFRTKWEFGSNRLNHERGRK